MSEFDHTRGSYLVCGHNSVGREVYAEAPSLFAATMAAFQMQEDDRLEDIRISDNHGCEWTLKHPMDGLGVS